MNTVPTVPRTMTAWRQTTYGSAEVVGRETVAVPEPRAGEVIVRVRATGLNAADIRIMRGDPALLRLGFGLRRPRAAVRGQDVCGTVVAVGAEVTAWRIGDEVVGEVNGGGLAEFVAAPAARFTRRPENLDPVAAAAIPLAGGTAVQALDAAGVAARHRVLVIGAGGGVGTFTVQLAVLRGAEVWALCGRRAEAVVADLGAARTFDYRATDVGTLDAGSVDAIIDIAGTIPLPSLQRLLRPGGTIVLVAAAGEGPLGPFSRMLEALVRSRRARRIRSLLALARPAITADLLAKAASGALGPVIERTWPLGEARAALAHVEAGHTIGKVVVVAD